MPAVGPDGMTIPDFQNPAAVRYARQMLQRLVHQGLIPSVAAATAHFGGDPTATWRALSRLTGAPTTTTLGPTGPPPQQPPLGPGPQAMMAHAETPPHYTMPPPGGQDPLAHPIVREVLTRLLGGQQGPALGRPRSPFRHELARPY